MRKPTNKLGTHGYGKFIETYRKSKPLTTHPAHKKSHKRKLKKAGADFSVVPPSKIKSKFDTQNTDAGSKESNESMRPTLLTTTMVVKAINTPEAYQKWLESYQATMAGKGRGGTATLPKPYGKPGQSHQEILTQARQGNVDTMNHPDAHNLRDAEGMSILHHLARKGKTEILTHPHVATTKDKLQRSPLHLLAEQNRSEILGHPNVADTHDVLGNTPLHILAQQANPDVLTHPDVSTVRNLKGRTPLHSAAFARTPGVEQHPDYNIVQDLSGRTSKHIFDGVSGQKPVEKGYANFEKAFFGDLKKSDPVKKEYKWHGLDICVEWPKGKVRKYGKDNALDGEVMKADYGYIKNTTSPDKEEIDCYVGSSKNSDKVFLLLQNPTPWDVAHGNTKPEEKYMLCFNSIEDAEKAYKGSGLKKFFGSIKEIKPEELLKKVKQNKLKKSITVSNQAVQASAMGPYTPVGVEEVKKSETSGSSKSPGAMLKEAQGNLKKDISSLPEASAEQGNTTRGPVYSWDENSNFGKSVNKKRLKLADKLSDLTKANAFVGTGGFAPHAHEKLTVEDAKRLPSEESSQPFDSVKKGLETLLKSETEDHGLMKYEKLNKIFRMKYRKDRLIDEEAENKAKQISKSLTSMKRSIDRIPRLVFHL
jgi:hypothetical protein